MDFSFLLLILSAMMIAGLFIFTLTVKRRSLIYYVFLLVLTAMLAWTTGNILAWYWFKTSGILVMSFVKFWYLGTCFLPVLLYLTSVLFINDRFRFTRLHALLFLPPTISYLTLLTNEVNGGLFYRHFSLTNTEAVFGPIFYFHTFFSYIYIGFAIYYFLSFSIRSAGLFSRQSLLTLTAVLFPLVINIIITLRLANLPVYYTSIGFSIAICLFFLSIIKYQFLSVMPIAMQTILDRMTDSFAVIDENHKITYHNKAFINTFKSFDPKLALDICDIFKNKPSHEAFAEILEDYINMVKLSGRPLSFDQWLNLDNEDRYFQVDVTPIYASETNILWGLLVFFKDTTQIHKALETIKKNQTMLMEQQHLASLAN